jgi:hypothetical protein
VTRTEDAAAPRLRLANDAVVTEVDPHPWAELGAHGGTGSGVILDGRATSVPFTGGIAGSGRTTTDNAEATSTCAAA